ncbi:MAG: DUF6893 family small protein [Jatrophihabitans sp.]
MESVGKAATAVMAVVVTGALVMGVRSIPDIKRYLKMRSM